MTNPSSPPAPMTAERLEEIRRELIPSDEWLAANQSDPWVASEVEVAKTVRPLFAHIDALTARVAELERERDEAREKALEEAAAHVERAANMPSAGVMRFAMLEIVRQIRSLKDTTP